MTFGKWPVASAVFLTLPLALVAQKGPTDLGTLGGTYSQANAINYKTGIAGSSTTTGDVATHAFVRLTSNATQLTDIGTLPGGSNSFGNGINYSGVVVGASEYNDPTYGVVTHAFRWSAGTIKDLGTLGGSASTAAAVNYFGVIVGDSTVDGDTADHAFWYNPKTGVLTDLGSLAGPTGNSAAYGLSEYGVAAGTSQTGAQDALGSPISHAVLWDLYKGTVTDIGSLGGTTAQANAVNNHGVAVGSGDTASSQTHAFLYSNGQMSDLGTLGGSSAQANAVNDYGVVVGSSQTTADAAVHAFIWTRAGGMVDLNSLLPAGSGWVLNSATGVNLNGKIVGSGTINGQTHAFVWNLYYEEEGE